MAEGFILVGPQITFTSDATEVLCDCGRLHLTINATEEQALLANTSRDLRRVPSVLRHIPPTQQRHVFKYGSMYSYSKEGGKKEQVISSRF
jgi:hypothetical protein